MPSLKAIFTADATQFFQTLRGMPSATANLARGIRQQMDSVFGRSRSTIFNPRQERDAVREYGEWWQKTLTEQSVTAATRSNRARALLRERENSRQRAAEIAAQNATDASVEAAARSNRARALLRERAERRAENQRRLQEEAYANSLRGRLGAFFSSTFGRLASAAAVFEGVRRTVAFVGETIRTNIAYNRVENTFAVVRESVAGATEEMKYLRTEADRVGFSLLGSADAYARFMVAAKSAGLSQEETRKIFSAVQQTGAVIGMPKERVAEALLALEQMLGKGTVMAQELRIQLGNALPGAMDLFAKAVGVSQKELYEMVEAGTLLSKDVLPKFADQLNRTFNLTDDANRTIRDLNRLENAWAEFKRELGKKVDPPAQFVLQQATETLRGDHARTTAAFLDPENSYEYHQQQTIEQDPVLRRMQRRREEEAKAIEEEARRQSEIDKARTDALPDHRVKPPTKETQRELDRIARETEQERRRGLEIGESDSKKRARLQKELAQAERDIAGAPWEGIEETELKARILARDKLRNDLKELDENRKRGRGGVSAQLTDQQSRGAFIGGPNVTLLDLNRQQLAELRGLRMDIKSHNRPQYASRRGVNFGGGARR
jgi:tape measure domain-containing protein